MATQFSAAEGRKWKAPFFTIWGGQAFSLLGSQLVQFALIWHLTVTTGSATVLAAASMAGLLPSILLGPFIGSLVDRWNRRVVMVAADAAIALATVGLALLFAAGRIEVWHIYVMMFLRDVGAGFHGAAMMAPTSLMVPKEHLSRIQGINQALNGGLNVAAAPLGAFLLDLLPMQGILAIDVLTALLAIAPLLFIAVPQPEGVEEQGGEPASLLRDLRAGLGYVASWPGMVILLVVAMLINLVVTPAFSLLPLLVSDHFNGGALQLGWLEASAGVGFIIGGLALSIWGGFKRRIATTLFGLVGLGGGLFFLGLLPPPAFYLSLGGAFVVGFMVPLIDGTLLAIVQASVAPVMQGRVLTLIVSAAKAMTPLGLGLAGPLADVLGLQFWYLASGIVCALAGGAGYFLPALMDIEAGTAAPERAPLEGEGAPLAAD